MEVDLISLFAIVVAAFICPVLAAIGKKRLIPETVFLLIVGMLIGPNVLGIAKVDSAISLLSDLGLGFLFLLAGYEIDTKELAGKQGRHGFLTWMVTFAIAVGVCFVIPESRENPMGWLAVAIALTTTAYGTIVPILRERGIADTHIGKAITNYGVWGELCPIIAIALVLSSRTKWITVLVLAAFALLAVLTAVFSKRLRTEETRLAKYIQSHSDGNAQMLIRVIMMLLVGLLAVSAAFELDIVLGAFAAGFIIRYIVPEGDKTMEYKLDSIGYGFFIPLFFVVSGMGIDPRAVAEYPLLLALFIVSLLLVRALPIFVSLRLNRETRSLSPQERATVSLYCATALPLIVAVTSIAVSIGAMTDDIASLLVAAGGISVFLMPLAASLSYKAIAVSERHQNAKENK